MILTIPSGDEAPPEEEEDRSDAREPRSPEPALPRSDGRGRARLRSRGRTGRRRVACDVVDRRDAAAVRAVSSSPVPVSTSIHVIADSEGKLVPNPNHGQKMAPRLRQAQRRAARKQKGSKNRNKALVRVSAKCAEWRREGFDARIPLEIHDEILFDFRHWQHWHHCHSTKQPRH